MTRNGFYRSIIIVGVAYFLAACAANNTSRSFMTVPNTGKFVLKYYTPSKEFPLYSRATVDDREFLVMDDAVIPSAQSLYFLTHTKISSGESVLDIGTGSGIQAVFAADTASSVVATDINPASIRVARLNAKKNGVSDIIEVRQGDLFAPIKSDEKFDVILFNIDYPFNEKTQGLWKIHERFFAEVSKYIKSGGRIYYQSGELENVSKINEMVIENGMNILSMRMDAALEVDRRPIVYLIKRTIDIEIKAKNDQ